MSDGEMEIKKNVTPSSRWHFKSLSRYRRYDISTCYGSWNQARVLDIQKFYKSR